MWLKCDDRDTCNSISLCTIEEERLYEFLIYRCQITSLLSNTAYAIVSLVGIIIWHFFASFCFLFNVEKSGSKFCIELPVLYENSWTCRLFARGCDTCLICQCFIVARYMPVIYQSLPVLASHCILYCAIGITNHRSRCRCRSFARTMFIYENALKILAIFM